MMSQKKAVRFLILVLCVFSLAVLLSAFAEAESLTISSVNADVALQALGKSVKWTANGTGAEKYYFYVYKYGNNRITKSGWQKSNTFSFTPTAEGYYYVRCDAEDASGKMVKQNSGYTHIVKDTKVSVSAVTADKPVMALNEDIRWNAITSGASKYFFYVFRSGSNTPVAKSGWQTSTMFSYAPKIPGNYYVRAYAKNAMGTIVSKTSEMTNCVQALPAISLVKLDKTDLKIGDSVTITISATNAQRYCCYIIPEGSTTAAKILPWTESTTMVYTAESAGNFTVVAYAQGESNATVNRTYNGILKVEELPIDPVITDVIPDSESVELGQSITWTVNASHAAQYLYVVYRSGSGTPVYSGTAVTQNTFLFTPAEPGEYTINVTAINRVGKTTQKNGGLVTVTEAVATETPEIG